MKSVGTVVGFIVVALVLGAVLSLLSGLFLMVAFYLVHTYAIVAVPAFGYWASVVLAYGLSVIGSILRGTSNTSKSND